MTQDAMLLDLLPHDGDIATRRQAWRLLKQLTPFTRRNIIRQRLAVLEDREAARRDAI